MKAITICNPFALMTALGAKRYETRDFETKYRGDILIHCGKNPRYIKFIEKEVDIYLRMGHSAPTDELAGCVLKILGQHPYYDMYSLYGKALCVATLTDCVLCSQVHNLSSQERALGFWNSAKYAWRLENIRLLPEFVAVKGQQQIWNIDPREIGLEQ